MTLHEDYQRDGAVVLRSVIAPHEVELLRQGIEAVLAAPSPRAKVASATDDPGFFLEDFCTWREQPAFSEFLQSTHLGRIARDLTGSAHARVYHDHILVKEPHTRQRTPWHQDQPYYDVQGRQNVSFWIPVDEVAQESSLELIRGSHLGKWLMPRSFLDAQAKWFPEGSLDEMPDYDNERQDHEILSWALQPGDVVAFHMLTVHGAAGVSGLGRRRVFSLRVLGDDMVYAPRKWETSPDMARVIAPDVDNRIPGQELGEPWFVELPSP